jgi:DNA-binding Lrp family transcriptional regulator
LQCANWQIATLASASNRYGCVVSMDLVDGTNRSLIDALVREPRATHRQLAAELGLNEVTVASRIRKLVEGGVLASTIAVDWIAAGYTHSMYLWLTCSARPAEDVALEIGQLEGVQNVSLVLGEADVFVHVLLPGLDIALLEVKDRIGAVSGATVIETNVILKHYVHRTDVTRLPIREAALPLLPGPVISLDELDVALCEQLAADARRSNRDIARELETSERTIRLRLRRLEESGLVRIVTMIDQRAYDPVNVTAFVAIRVHGDSSRIAAELARSPRVGGLTATTGGADLYAVASARDASELAAWVIDDLGRMPGVVATSTSLVARSVLFGTRLRRFLPFAVDSDKAASRSLRCDRVWPYRASELC